MSKVSVPTLIIALLVIFILLTFACTYQVSFNEAAVKVRLGRPQDLVTTAGLKFRWPWPIESIERYDTRLRTLDAPETEIKTSDGKNVVIGTYAVWKITQPLQFFVSKPSVAEMEKTLRERVSTAQATVVGRRTLSDFVNLDRRLLEESYDTLLDEMRAELDDLSAVCGIQVVQIGVRRISLPKEVTQEVFKSMIQDRKTLAARYREEGKSRAEAITARAEADSKQILAFADRKAQEIRSAGIQASTRILSQIAAGDREFFEWLRWLDALKASLKQKTTIFIDKDWPLFEPFVKPPVQAESQP